MSYNDMFQAFKEGRITLQEWNEFCMDLLYQMMEDNCDVFIRLKDR